ncbi:hypothetical protein scyTo_0026267, partial [Scyliorhinus torazame]|nr:hypothetical protein [Scyliorhinus torazame]
VNLHMFYSSCTEENYKVKAVDKKEEINAQEDFTEDDDFFIGVVESSIKNDLQGSKNHLKATKPAHQEYEQDLQATEDQRVNVIRMNGSLLCTLTQFQLLSNWTQVPR